MTKALEIDHSTTYEIRINGILDSSWSDWFDGFSITTQGNETILLGVVVDQPALHGILAKISDLGLILISVEKLPRGE